MRFTKAQVEELSRTTCPHCKAGSPVRFRTDTAEWVHDQVVSKFGTQAGHSICWANGIRKEHASG
jgi:hypothetical protein